MKLTTNHFDEIKNRIDSQLEATNLSEKKLDEAAKLILLNSQYAAALEVFHEKKHNLTVSQIDCFMQEFEGEVEKFEQIVSDFVGSI